MWDLNKLAPRADAPEVSEHQELDQDSQAAVVLRDVKADMAVAAGTVARLKALKMGAARLALPVRHGFVAREAVTEELVEQADNVGLVDAVGPMVVLTAIEGGLDSDEPPPQPLAPGQAPAFRSAWLATVEDRVAQVYLVEGVLPDAGIVVVWGPPKCGKSFLVSDMALAIARSLAWRGRVTGHGGVVYCCLEGQAGFQRRLVAYRRRYELDGVDVPFLLITQPLILHRDRDALVRFIRDAFAGRPRLRLVVIDTLNRSIGGSENDDTDMTAYITAAEAIRQAFDCLVVIVHHCGVEGTRPRGHTSLTGAVDGQIKVVMDAGVISATVEYLKDGPVGLTFASRLEVVDLGTDAGGMAVNSCVLVEAEGAEVSAPKRRDWPSSPRMRLYRAALVEALGSHGEERTPWIVDGPTLRAVDRKWVREEFMKAYPADNAGAKRQAFSKAEQQARGTGLIGSRVVGEQELVWLV